MFDQNAVFDMQDVNCDPVSFFISINGESKVETDLRY
jgi:hypothetical protein